MQKLKEVRKARGLSQRELAKRVGISYQSVSGYENGITYPGLPVARALADVLEVTLDELFPSTVA